MNERKTESHVETKPKSHVYGEVLLHPLSILCLVIWAVNDHYGKGAWPGWLSGKLSDIVSLIGFSLISGALIEMMCGFCRVELSRARRIGLFACQMGALSAAIVMIGINIWPTWAEAYEVGLGAVQWKVFSGWYWLTNQPIPPCYRVSLTMDYTDTFTAPAALGGPWLYRKMLIKTESQINI